MILHMENTESIAVLALNGSNIKIDIARAPKWAREYFIIFPSLNKLTHVYKQ